MKRRTVLSLEQALSLPSGTARFVQQGFRVIRIEATPHGPGSPGDPNRYVGPDVDVPDRRGYFFGPNAGKETIALKLRSERGRALLLDLVTRLPVDIFAVNTLPKRYEDLGISYERLSGVRPELIWIGISAYGPKHPEVPGYDPALQAELGYMDVTGEPAGPPLLSGVPMVDLKAGDEAFAQACLALAEQADSGIGKRIDISMAQTAASWLMTMIPLLDLGASVVPPGRSGNEHREFAPVNVYPCRDGFLYLAIGNDIQWQRLCGLDPFAGLTSPNRSTNAGRAADREALNGEISSITLTRDLNDLLPLLRKAGLVAAPVNPISKIPHHPAIAPHLLSTSLADGSALTLAPPPVDTPYLESNDRTLPSPPRYGQHTRALLAEIGIEEATIESLIADKVVAASSG